MSVNRTNLKEIAERVALRNRSVKRGHPKYAANVSSEEERLLTDGVLELLDILETAEAERDGWRRVAETHEDSARRNAGSLAKLDAILDKNEELRSSLAVLSEHVVGLQAERDRLTAAISALQSDANAALERYRVEKEKMQTLIDSMQASLDGVCERCQDRCKHQVVDPEFA